ncbi:MAG: thiolase family protein, partial [Candidatus Bathyarchaeia archaeon]
RRVAVVAVQQTRHASNRRDSSSSEMVYEVARGALNSLGIDREQIDTVVESSSDYWDGTGCSNIATVDAAGANLKEESKVEEDGALAFVYGYMRILSGLFDTALVVSHTKTHPRSSTAITSLSCDPIFQRPVGLDDISGAAMQAALYMKHIGATKSQLALVVTKNLGNALKNKFAHRRANITVQDVLESKVLAHPLHNLDCAVPCDGACAVVLASERMAHKLTSRPAWIEGLGYATDSYYLGDRDLLGLEALKTASRKAYRAAGISKPSDQIDVAEIAEPFSYMELLHCEKLGLCREGFGGQFIENGVTQLKGKLPVNPSGGVISTNPYIARGLLRIGEAAMQVMRQAEAHQVSGCELALAHSTSGLSGQLHTAVILSSKERRTA